MPHHRHISPPLTALHDVLQVMRDEGFAVLDAQAVSCACATTPFELNRLLPSWNRLAEDRHLKDAGNYRRRRHGSYLLQDGVASLQAHRAHWQSLDYNALHGGMQRWFEPLESAVADSVVLHALLCWLATLADGMHGVQPWFAEVHQFRIDASDGIGRPTPEGAHRDGVHLVAVFVLARHSVRGGETRVFHMDDRFGQRFTVEQPWSVLLLDDQRVIHESTPVQPQHSGAPAWRDTLVVTLRAEGFQQP